MNATPLDRLPRLTGVHIALTLSFSAQGESCCWVIDYRLSGCLISALVTLRDAVPRTCKWLVTHVVASLKAEGEPRRGLTGVHLALTLSFSAQGESCCWVID